MSKTFTKGLLSGSTDGRAIKVVATSSAGTTIHTATGAANLDAVSLVAYNSDTVARLLTIQWGGTTSVDDDCKITIPSQTGWLLVVDRLLLRNSLIIKAYAAAANVITINGWVDNIA